MPRFVVLIHNHPSLHWDFMLECTGVLRTWRLSRPPAADGRAIPAEPLADHRIAYLDYEGPVRGDRGEVTRFDAGQYEIVESSSERLSIRIVGHAFRGTASLDLAHNPPTWTFNSSRADRPA